MSSTRVASLQNSRTTTCEAAFGLFCVSDLQLEKLKKNNNTNFTVIQLSTPDKNIACYSDSWDINLD